TPAANHPLTVSLSFTFNSGGGYVAVTDGASGNINPTYGAPSDGLSFMFWWGSGLDVVDNATGTSDNFGASFSLNTLYDATITDNGSAQTVVVTNDQTGQVVVSETISDFSNHIAGNVVEISNREDNDAMHTATVNNVTVSNAYVEQNGTVMLAGLTRLTDSHESMSLDLSGFPPGATFSAGALDANTGHWIITSAEITALGSNALTMTTPSDYDGNFTLHVDATVTDTVVGPSGPLSNTQTFSNDFAVVTADHWNGSTVDSNDWSTGPDWSYGSAPGVGNDAVVDASGAYTLTISSSDKAFAHSLTITSAGAGADVQDEGSLTLGGALTIDAGSFSLIGGNLSATSIDVESAGHLIAEGSVSPPITNHGGIVQANGNLTLSGTVTGNGTFDVNGHMLTFSGSVAGGTVDFDAGNRGGTLAVAEASPGASNFGAAISNFGSGDTIDLTGVGYTSGEYAIWTQGTDANASSGTLAIYDANNNLEASLNLSGTYTTSNFSVVSDGAGTPGTAIQFSSNNNGDGNNNGPVVSGANNSVAYQGIPVLIDPAVSLSDAEATVSSVNVWISAGSQAGDELTIDGNTDGQIVNSDGSIIHYHFDNTPGVNNGQGPGIFLSNIGNKPATIADFQAAMQLIQFAANGNDPTAAGTDNSRTITWSAYDNINHSQNVSTTVNLEIVPNYAWSVAQYPSVVEGEHLFGVNPQSDSFAGVVALAYGEASNYAATETSYTITHFVEALDPFFLPDRHAAQTIDTSTVDLPARYNFTLPNVNTSAGIRPEGIFIYKAQDATGANVLWQVIGTPDNNGDGGVTLGDPTEIGSASTTQYTIYDLTEGFRNASNASYAQSYDVAWDQYNSANSHYSLELDITPISTTNGSFGTPVIFSPVIDESGDTSVTVGTNALPAWYFRAGGGHYDLAIAEADAQTNTDVIHFQGYNEDGTANAVSFFIHPDLTAYASGATNEIVQQTIPSISPFPGQTVQGIQFLQVSGTNGSDYAVLWNETVIDSKGTHDQVEFDVLHGDGSGVSHATFQIPDGDPQNIRLGEFTDPANSSQDDVVVVYGDDSGTHILEYAVTNGGSTVTELASFTDPTTQAFDNLTVLGDGRITLTYDQLVNPSPDETSQYLFKTFDLRTAGIHIDDSGKTDAQNQYVAGTHYSDTFVGENNVNNEYYDVGQGSTSSAPVDHFTGGSSGWNVAIFDDARSDYTISTNGGVTSVASNGLDPEHSGSLVASNVQVLAFGPAADPMPHNGVIDVNGGTDVVLAGTGPITIEAGSTAEIDTGAPYAGTVTFEAATGTLALDQPANFTGVIAGITGADTLDLNGFDPNTTTAVTGNGSFDGTNTTLTVTDASHSETFKLAGNLSGSSWTISSDQHGGVDIVDPPATPAAAAQTVVAGAANQTLTGTGAAENFVFNFSGFGQDTVTNFHPETDTLQFNSSMFATAQAALDAARDDGHGNTVIVEGHDTVTLTGILKANLHLSDFHVG
ncbi:MAG: hypothetical protein JO141_32370, partial [Bradyrhizobium sp.]|nr:hypothetical protein [Bradyrhizobium sp.]